MAMGYKDGRQGIMRWQQNVGGASRELSPRKDWLGLAGEERLATETSVQLK